MKVILKDNIEGVGQTGQVINVATGYARNYLLPRKKAVLAEERNVKMLNHQKLLAEHHKARLVKEAQTLSKRLSGVQCQVYKHSGENDRLHGAVTAMDIEDALRSEGVEIDRRSIQLSEPIKALGKFEVDIKLHPEVVTKLTVFVLKKD